jgi:hypothetical protein
LNRENTYESLRFSANLLSAWYLHSCCALEAHREGSERRS